MASGKAGRSARSLVAALVGVCGAACSLVTSFDGLTTPEGDAGADAPAPPPVPDAGGGGHPGPVDASEGGDEVPVDGGTPIDAPNAPDAPLDGPYCLTLGPSPLFCDDFDEYPLDAAALASPWDQMTGLGGTVVRDGKAFTSAPLAMLVTSTAGVAAIDLCGYKAFKAAKTSGQYTLAFDLDVEQADTTQGTSDAILAAIELLDSTGSRWALQLEVSYDATLGALAVNLSENESFGKDAATTYTGHAAKGTLPVGGWTHVTIDATIGTSSVGALHFGTQEVAKPTITPDTVNGYPQILVGGTYAEKSAKGWTVRYDNVTFNVK